MSGSSSEMVWPTAFSAPRRRPIPPGTGMSATPSVVIWCIGNTSAWPWSVDPASPGTVKPSPPAPFSPGRGASGWPTAPCAGTRTRSRARCIAWGWPSPTNLYSWTKYEHNPVNERDPRLYERLGPVHKAYGQWRDPILFHAGDRVYQYVCARSKSPDRNRRGTVGLATSRICGRGRLSRRCRLTPSPPRSRSRRCTGSTAVLPALLHLDQPSTPSVQAPVSRPPVSQRRLLDGRRVTAGTVSPPRHR